MRSIIWIVSLTIALGVLVARYADKIVSAPDQNSASSGATMIRSSSVTAITVPSPEPLPSSRAQAPAKSALPQVITLSPSSSPSLSSSYASGRTITLRSDSSGQFQTQARVDGRRVDFVVDTGASAVVLRASTAAQLGIRPAASEYTAKVLTANGETRAAIVQLNSIEVGDITVRDVRALVQADETLGMNLLGMTFLSRVRWSHDRGKLVLEQ